jgi:hypothetical protein
MNKRFLGVLLSVIAVSGLLAADTQTPPAVGQTAPDFSLPSGEGGSVSLKDYKGKWVVLYFYPKDFTGGCTLEAHNFQSDLAKYQNESAIILGAIAQGFLCEGGIELQIAGGPGTESDNELRIAHGARRCEDGGAEHVPD